MAPKKSHSYNLLKNFEKFQFESYLLCFMQEYNLMKVQSIK